MSKLLVLVLGCCFLLTACGGSQSSAPVADNDTTERIEQMEQEEVEPTEETEPVEREEVEMDRQDRVSE